MERGLNLSASTASQVFRVIDSISFQRACFTKGVERGVEGGVVKNIFLLFSVSTGDIKKRSDEALLRKLLSKNTYVFVSMEVPFTQDIPEDT